ncbi:hypothetical protein LINPERPRIM_LOCUS35878 [Linum perenne]
MRGTKRLAASSSELAPARDAIDTAMRSKRVTGSYSDVDKAETSQSFDMQRAELSRQHVRALNSQFASWVQTQLKNHPDELWEDGVRDYLAHASSIMEKFSDVVNWLKANAAKDGTGAESSATEKKLSPETEKDVSNETAFPSTSTNFTAPWPSVIFSNDGSSGAVSSNQNSGLPQSNIQSSSMFSSSQSTVLRADSQSPGLLSSNQSSGLFSNSLKLGSLTNNQNAGLFSQSQTQSPGSLSNSQGVSLFSNSQTQSSGLLSDSQGSGIFSSSQGAGLFTNGKGPALFSSNQSSGLFSNSPKLGSLTNNQNAGLFSQSQTQSPGSLSNSQGVSLFSNSQTQSSGLLSDSQGSGIFSSSQGAGLFTNGKGPALFSNSQTTGSFSSTPSSGIFSMNPSSSGGFFSSQAPILFGGQSSAPASNNASDDADDGDELPQPSSPSVKKAEEKGVVVVHEVKCKLYVKSIDPADKDTWKDKGPGQLSIKCFEGVSKGTKESNPTLIVRNDVGKVLLNALLYQGIKTNLQKNSVVAIFHVAADDSGSSDSVMARTFLIRTKTEDDRNKLSTAIREYAPES